MAENRDRPFLAYYPMVLLHAPFEPTPDSLKWGSANRTDLKDVANFPETVAYTDKLVAKLVDRIDALGLSEKTLSYAMMPSTTSPWMSVRLNSRPAYR